MREWQLMDTAPTQPSGFILLVVKNRRFINNTHAGYYWEVRIGFWDDLGHRWLGCECFERYSEGKIKGHLHVIKNPTHWMPLPSPPKEVLF